MANQDFLMNYAVGKKDLCVKNDIFLTRNFFAFFSKKSRKNVKDHIGARCFVSPETNGFLPFII